MDHNKKARKQNSSSRDEISQKSEKAAEKNDGVGNEDIRQELEIFDLKTIIIVNWRERLDRIENKRIPIKVMNYKLPIKRAFMSKQRGIKKYRL